MPWDFRFIIECLLEVEYMSVMAYFQCLRMHKIFGIGLPILLMIFQIIAYGQYIRCIMSGELKLEDFSNVNVKYGSINFSEHVSKWTNITS